MIPNNSPWIKQLKRTRPVVPLATDVATDVAIVGGGIAGVTTAFFTLRHTDKKVVLIEADKVAHGATGHNAGQITSYFERPLSDLVAAYGLDRAIDAQRSVESAWSLIDQIVAEARLQTPLYRFTGYAGLSSMEHVLQHLEDNRCRVAGGLTPESIVLAEEWDGRAAIPDGYASLYTVAPQRDILSLLETHNPDYVGVLAFQKGCMNSALFSEELIGYLIATYPSRFSFFEESPMKTVRLSKDGAVLEVLGHSVRAANVVLCTNGFEHFSIVHEGGPDIDTTFHQSVAGRIGYMSGYVEPLNRPPTAISYFPKVRNKNDDPTGESYFYLTRRPHEHEGNNSYNLTCVGGPERVLPNGAGYSRDAAYAEDARMAITQFLKDTYRAYPPEGADHIFSWHGLMGYTPDGIRRVGPEPLNPVLLYNLGCNGVGILPSIFGGLRISQYLQGEAVPPSLFDPARPST